MVVKNILVTNLERSIILVRVFTTHLEWSMLAASRLFCNNWRCIWRWALKSVFGAHSIIINLVSLSLSLSLALGSLLARIKSVRVQNCSHLWARLGRPPSPLTECHLSLELMQTQHSFREYLLKHQMQAFRAAFNSGKTKGWRGGGGRGGGRRRGPGRYQWIFF